LPLFGNPIPKSGRLAVREPVLLELVEERLVRQVEEPRGTRAVAAGDLERLPQALLLVRLPRDAARRQAKAALPPPPFPDPRRPRPPLPGARRAGPRRAPPPPPTPARAARRRSRARARSPASRGR